MIPTSPGGSDLQEAQILELPSMLLKMTAAEIVMKRDDPNIAWGFRLTGGSDLGTPFYVVKNDCCRNSDEAR
ncbi:hypothetical protein J6590_091665 [Homalodisca vitripennis]|nr:hypothetical protein J6590_091665 [Homalodisca vitripennis]